MTDPFTVYEKHPHMDAYRYGPSFTPYAIVAVEKRFTDAELAAEAYRQNLRAIGACGSATIGADQGEYQVVPSDVMTYGPMRREVWQSNTLIRFARLPHFDD